MKDFKDCLKRKKNWKRIGASKTAFVTGAFFPFLKSINITISNEKIQFEAKNISDEKKSFCCCFSPTLQCSVTHITLQSTHMWRWQAKKEGGGERKGGRVNRKKKSTYNSNFKRRCKQYAFSLWPAGQHTLNLFLWKREVKRDQTLQVFDIGRPLYIE